MSHILYTTYICIHNTIIYGKRHSTLAHTQTRPIVPWVRGVHSSSFATRAVYRCALRINRVTRLHTVPSSVVRRTQRTTSLRPGPVMFPEAFQQPKTLPLLPSRRTLPRTMGADAPSTVLPLRRLMLLLLLTVVLLGGTAVHRCDAYDYIVEPGPEIIATKGKHCE